MKTDNLNSPEFWDLKYINGNDAWNLGSHTPVFEDLLKNNYLEKGKTLLIPGAGISYDAVLAAKFGLNVSVMDFSKTAIEETKKIAEKNNVNINFILGDFFQPGKKYISKFDYIFEYVLFCAIEPSKRNEYAQRIYNYLAPNGKLFALLFPVDNRPGGPPFAVDPNYFKLIFNDLLILEKMMDNINSINPRKGKEVLHIYKKDN